MKPQLECGPCILKWVFERAGAVASEDGRFQLIRSVMAALSRGFHPGANVGSISNEVTGAIDEFILNCADHYANIKRQSNELAKDLLPAARDFVERGQTPKDRLGRACGLAAVSNIAPIGAPSDAFRFEEAAKILEGENSLPESSRDVCQSIQRAAHVLYVTDNAGEIGFDSLFIAYLKKMGSRVTLIVKEDPFFEDATAKDVSFFGLDRLADDVLTAKGFFVPTEATLPLADAFRQSDLVIAKGTGNFEALKGEIEDKTVIHLLKVKCRPIAIETGSNLGSFVIFSSAVK